MTSLGILQGVKGKLVLGENVGQAAQFVQSGAADAGVIALSLALLPLAMVVGDWVIWVNIVTMWIAVILTVVSGIDYVVTEVRGARTQRRARS